MDNENPLYPILIDDYPKLFDYVLTMDGLTYFYQLKRDFLLGRNLSHDEYNKIRLLYVYYAAANRNPKEVFNWQEICTRLSNDGISENGMQESKNELISLKYIVANPNYTPGLYRKHIQYLKSMKSE